MPSSFHLVSEEQTLPPAYKASIIMKDLSPQPKVEFFIQELLSFRIKGTTNVKEPDHIAGWLVS